MRDVNYQLKILCKHSHEGSFETRVGSGNDFYGIPDRQFVSEQSKAKELAEEQLVKWVEPGIPARSFGQTQQIQKSPTKRVRLFCIWRARHDSNVRPPGS